MLSLANDLSLSDVLHRIVEISCELIGAGYGAMAVVGPNRQLLEFIAGDEDVRAEFGDPRSIGNSGLRDFLGVPVHVRGEVFGNLYLAGKPEFTDEDEEIIVAVAAAAGVAIHNARLFEQTRQREGWLRASNEVTSALLTGTSGRDALTLVANRARTAAGGVVSALILPGGSGDLLLEVMDGGIGQAAEGLTVPRDGSNSYEVFDSGRTMVLDRPTMLDGPIVDELNQVGPVVLVPMPAGDRMLGVLMVARGVGEHPFDEADVELVESFAGQAALVLEFTRAQGDTQRLAVLEDRDRIARDLHDLVIQRLFGLGLGLQGLNGMVMRPVVAARLAGFVDEVDQTIREIRRTIFSLQEVPSGMASLRGQLLRAVQESAGMLGFEPTVALDGPLDSLIPDPVRPDLLATLREALTNVVRHAGAHAVDVKVTVDRAATRLQLVIRDDGRGLAAGEPHRSGGLFNMTARARRWHGDCSIQSSPGKGVTVAWSVPLQEERCR